MHENIYLHALTTDCEVYRSYKSYELLKKILKSGYVLSKKMQGRTTHEGFNGSDYISLCDYSKRNIYSIHYPQTNAYESYIRHHMSLIFPQNALEVIEPIVVDTSILDDKYFEYMDQLGESKTDRYTDLPDEVQVKDKISLKIMSGITIPIRKIRIPFYGPEETSKNIIKELQKLKKLLLNYGYDIPIYDIDTMYLLADENNVKQLVKKYY